MKTIFINFLPVIVAIVGSLIMYIARKPDGDMAVDIFEYILTQMRPWGWIGVVCVIGGIGYGVGKIIYAWIINPLK